VSFLKNALIYLGFVEDDIQGEIASYGEPSGHRPARQYDDQDRYEPAPTRSYEDPRAYDYTEREPRQRREPVEQRQMREAPRRSEPMASVHQFPPRSMGQVHIVRPESYGDAQQIGDRMRNGLPVIVNLEEAESELARRVVAFASGLVYGLDGNLQKLSRRIYLITPGEMEVSSEDKRRLVEDTGLGF
jgi:cell division inhibitor SepF